jgi:hypothetical protein
MVDAHLTRRQFLAGSASLVATNLFAADWKVAIIDTQLPEADHAKVLGGTAAKLFGFKTG